MTIIVSGEEAGSAAAISAERSSFAALPLAVTVPPGAVTASGSAWCASDDRGGSRCRDHVRNIRIRCFPGSGEHTLLDGVAVHGPNR
ncbi:hypothetical protein P3102_15545 [Amycolatopsis sp. QT-25]|uniref:hypothetical protein n=1 Tax=Amycolatopsis sp. QT-25 TaxID=3034022 RepID=UPI0023ECF108|nr:hypothetical protein [Amycolatopsis sp. QT-25]WET82516.1 hypothetical protein P3102_15545 [Amycolatopsis sp. QT-25]